MKNGIFLYQEKSADTFVLTLKKMIILLEQIRINTCIIYSLLLITEIKMQFNKILFISIGLLFIGCNSEKIKKHTAKTDQLSVDTAYNKTSIQENIDNKSSPTDSKVDSINALIVLFKTQNIDLISTKIKFPLGRKYPIPSIKDKGEFKHRFSEVFDQKLLEKIINSTPDQWSEMGWRGTMFEQGTLWMENSDGVITSVNYQSDFEKKWRKELIAKEELYSSLKIYTEPIYKIKTASYLIRIDALSDGKYRYASWKTNQNESTKPDILLFDGELKFEGSGGNQVITFINGGYTYSINKNNIGTKDTAQVVLQIEKDGQLILTEEGHLIME